MISSLWYENVKETYPHPYSDPAYMITKRSLGYFGFETCELDEYPLIRGIMSASSTPSSTSTSTNILVEGG